MKKLVVILLAFTVFSCTPSEIQNVLDTVGSSTAALTTGDISNGLKEALNKGISKGADQLSKQNGYFSSPYKILLPPEARKVTDKLKNVPLFSDIENEIVKRLNQGAEDAAKKAKPIFIGAIKQMSFNDATNILMGQDDAATRFLRRTTYDKLYAEFNPVIVNSLDKFKAREYWADAVNTYNKIPFVDKVNSDLDDYVTKQALSGLFKMVEKEESNIRHNLAARTTDLLKRVFAKQDNK